MSRRSSRSSEVTDPAAFLAKMRSGRDAIIDELQRVQLNLPHYNMLHVMLSSIDVAAEFFTGNRYFFLNQNPDCIGLNTTPDA